MAIRVEVSGNKFMLNGGVKESLFTRSSFSTMHYLCEWAEGQGGWYEDAVDRFFERCKRQGFDGVRVFGETSGWRRGTSPFFSKQATRDNLWNLNALRLGHRPTELEILNQKIILKLIEKLQKHDLVCEYVTDATLKHDGVKAETIGHCIRQTARFLRHVEEGIIDPEIIHPSLHTPFQKVLSSGDVNIFHELHNEWDAHNQAGLTLNELTLQFHRHRRLKYGKPEQWPRGIVGVSHGGRNKITYPVSRPNGADYVALHPERSGEWWTFTDLERRYSGVPRYYNESKHYVSPEEWDKWVAAGVFSPVSSTKDLDKYLEFMDNTRMNGISFCVHDFVGMASGYFEQQTLDITPLEEELGDGVNPPPPPPPPPPPEDDLTTGELALVYHGENSEGRQDVTVLFPHDMMPLLLEGGREQDAVPKVLLGPDPGSEAIGNNRGVFRGKYTVKFDRKRYITDINIFHGLDRGDVVEMDTFIYGPAGERLLMKSDHKETMSNYPAYTLHHAGVEADKLYIHLVLRVNGTQMNEEHPRFKELTARGHFGIEISTERMM